MGAAAGVSLGVGAVGSLLGGFGQKGADDLKVKADQMNAQLANQRAASALQQGAYQAGQINMRGSQIIGSERTAYGSSGVDENVGTAAAVQAGTRAQADLDATMAENNATREAWGLQVNARQDQMQEQLDERAGNESLAGSILGGLGGVAGDASRFKWG